ncbi:PHD finger protein ALFIN-LIKE 3-like [Anneissia japonica]|uniref:PHD finger protein ALFIN-LIKE 3-like n=1 Tax=Anneissia japonica TaxID=1529436 RepID=UPI00142596D8|nr:PHD finger protein ALFIN-LIKE 3-like [Anneissia japonica]
MLMLGREINLPADLMFAQCQSGEAQEVGDYISELVCSIRDAHDTARETLKETQKRMKKNYDLRVLKRPYQRGDRVYILDNSTPKDNADDAPGTLYCSCHKPLAGAFMIQCDYCDVWYHGSCVNISPSDALDIDLYKFAQCRNPGQLTIH